MATRRTKAELEAELRNDKRALASLRDTCQRTEDELRRVTSEAADATATADRLEVRNVELKTALAEARIERAEARRVLAETRENATTATRRISDERDQLAVEREQLREQVKARDEELASLDGCITAQASTDLRQALNSAIYERERQELARDDAEQRARNLENRIAELEGLHSSALREMTSYAGRYGNEMRRRKRAEKLLRHAVKKGL